MRNYRTVARHVLTLFPALALCACLSDFNDSEIALEITSPTSLSEMDTTDALVSVAGTAESEAGIFQVSWTNDRGGEGIADGTDAWQVHGLELQLGTNKITVTAEDIAGVTDSRSITINRESGQTGSATLAWEPPTSREDGSPLTNLAGYKIFYGRMSGVYDYQIDIDNPGVSTYVVEELVSGDWYFALAAYDSEGLESDRSNEVVRNIS
jgi:hypothetical protein